MDVLYVYRKLYTPPVSNYGKRIEPQALLIELFPSCLVLQIIVLRSFRCLCALPSSFTPSFKSVWYLCIGDGTIFRMQMYLYCQTNQHFEHFTSLIATADWDLWSESLFSLSACCHFYPVYTSISRRYVATAALPVEKPSDTVLDNFTLRTYFYYNKHIFNGGQISMK